MPEELANLSTDELKTLFTAETARFMRGIDNSISFDSLKEIRIKLRQIEEELQNRGIAF